MTKVLLKTFSLLEFGSSIPITERPGIVETLVAKADIDLAISSDKEITRLAFKPAAGSSSYRVTTGPGLTEIMLPLTP